MSIKIKSQKVGNVGKNTKSRTKVGKIPKSRKNPKK